MNKFFFCVLFLDVPLHPIVPLTFSSPILLYHSQLFKEKTAKSTIYDISCFESKDPTFYVKNLVGKIWSRAKSGERTRYRYYSRWSLLILVSGKSLKGKHLQGSFDDRVNSHKIPPTIL